MKLTQTTISNMKKSFYLMSMLLVAGMTLMTAACGKDKNEPDDPTKPDNPTVVDPDTPVQDPASTVTVNILNNSEKVSLGGSVEVYMDEANNLCAYAGSYEEADIVNVGVVAGLGNIVEIPTVGWKQKAVLNPGEGYIVRHRDHLWSGNGYYWGQYTYARIYVVSYLGSVESGISGAQIKYQCPFQLPIKLSTKSVTFAAEDEGLVQTIDLLNPTDVTVKEKPEWLTVSIEDLLITMTAPVNYSGEQRTGTMTLSNDEGDVQVEVKQLASSDPLFSKGSGTREDPYQVSTAKQLDNVRKVTNSHFIQTADIDLSTYISSNGNGWEPIPLFTGSYNGQFHKIKGLWINKPNTDWVGLFSSVDISSSFGDYEYWVTGVILEISEKGIIGKSHVGGIAGGMSDRSTITQCSVSGNIYARGDFAGGIAGYASDYNSISQCKFKGDVSANGYYAGGICGYNAVCDNCCVLGSVVAAGYYDYAYAISMNSRNLCGYFFNEGSNQPHAYGSYIVVWNSASDAAAMYAQSSYEGFNFNTVWTIDEGKSLPELRCFK